MCLQGVRHKHRAQHSAFIYSAPPYANSAASGEGSIINFQTLKTWIMEKKLSLEMLNNVSEIEVVYKKKFNVKVSQRPIIKTSKDGEEILRNYWDEEKIE